MQKNKKNNIVYFLVLIYFFICIKDNAQGLWNNGARIVFAGPAYMYINGAAGNFSNTSGGLVTPSQTSTIFLQGSWINNAANTVFTADGGTVIMNGALTTQSIGGTNPTAFTHLRLNGTNDVSLAVNNVTVGGATSFTGSLFIDTRPLILNSNMLHHTNPFGTSIMTNGTGRMVSETNAAVNPSILRWYVRTSAGLHEVPFGTLDPADNRIPLGFNITNGMINTAGYVDFSTRKTTASDNLPWAGASNVAAVSFFYCPNIPLTGNPCAANSVIDRWWDITNSDPVTADVTFRYRGAENTLNAPYNTGNIGAQFWTGSLWDQNNATYGSALAVTTGTGAVTATGIGTFCPWILSSVSVPLPVELLDFKMECNNGVNKILHWSVISDIPLSYFEIQGSNDALNFTRIATVQPNAYNNAITQYRYELDKNQSFAYYRILMVDAYNQAKKSKTIDAANDCAPANINVFYNPALGIVLDAMVSDNMKAEMNLFDVSGKLIKYNHTELNKGYNRLLWAPELAEGVYVLELKAGSEIKYIKIPYRN
jgi:hypothetical protein